MERATKVKAVVFDKTGTLTLGKPTVVEHRIFDPEVCQTPCMLPIRCPISQLPPDSHAHPRRVHCAGALRA